MSKSAWPTTTELTDRLTGLGVTTIPTGVSLQDELDGAVAALHRAIGYSPYLAGVSASYDYTPPRSFTLLLGGPFFTVTGVKTNKTNDYAGDALTEGVDYWLKGLGPYSYIEFETRQYGDPNSIEVTGQRGATDDIPVDLWKAVLDYAAAGVMEQSVGTGQTTAGPMTSVKQGAMSVSFASQTEPLFETLRKKALGTFAGYKRTVLVGASQ